MAAVAEKARLQLERTVPQLREFEERKIFSRDEIRILVRKRAEHEHRVLGQGSMPSAFLAYAAWERSLDALRLKRQKRLRIQPHKLSHRSASACRGRTYAIFERGVERHPGSIELWRAYLALCAEIGARRRWKEVAARALRMHPHNAALWMLVGATNARMGDMQAARAVFMRGCRFCDRDASLWVEYAKCEMKWLEHVEKKIGGGKNRKDTKKSDTLEETVKQLEAVLAAEAAEQDGDVVLLDEESDDDEDEEGGMVQPDAQGEDAIRKGARKAAAKEAVEKLAKSPALAGAIPMAIFEMAKKQSFFDAAACEQFLDMLHCFSDVSCQAKLVQKVRDTMDELYPHDPITCDYRIREPLLGLVPSSPAFPRALRDTLARLRAGMEQTSDHKALVDKTLAWIDTLLEMEDLDRDIRTVLEHSKKKLHAPLPI